MNKATILIISENTDRSATLVDTLGNQFYTLTASSDETAISQFLQSRIDAAVFGEDLTDIVKNKLTRIFSTQQADTAFVNDKGGVDISEEIANAILQQQKENKPAFSFKDDALKNAGLNIEIQ
ncbi:MAG: hypothetical protein EOO13_19590 [Chitinophagaceae bacterium]|nr:MAG: hypothetical protein EOO13_19590 [Chitinophagaceae bacterium]